MEVEIYRTGRPVVTDVKDTGINVEAIRGAQVNKISTKISKQIKIKRNGMAGVMFCFSIEFLRSFFFSSKYKYLFSTYFYRSAEEINVRPLSIAA